MNDQKTKVLTKFTDLYSHDHDSADKRRNCDNKNLCLRDNVLYGTP